MGAAHGGRLSRTAHRNTRHLRVAPTAMTDRAAHRNTRHLIRSCSAAAEVTAFFSLSHPSSKEGVGWPTHQPRNYLDSW